MKIWKENYREWVGRNYDGIVHRSASVLRGPWRYSSVRPPEEVLFVRVCSFTFIFYSVAEIREYLDYYSRKIHPSTAIGGMNGGHSEFQSKFDELPLYLREEPKRKQVVKALSAALIQMQHLRPNSV